MPQMFPSYHTFIFCFFILIFFLFMCSIYWQNFPKTNSKKLSFKESFKVKHLQIW